MEDEQQALIERARQEARSRAHREPWLRKKAEKRAEIAERTRQFEVVCKIAFQEPFEKKRRSMMKIGVDAFGLTRSQAQHGMGRARNLLAEIQELAQMRQKRRLPVDSDAAIELGKLAS